MIQTGLNLTVPPLPHLASEIVSRVLTFSDPSFSSC